MNEYWLVAFSGVLTGMIASTSVTSKAIEEKPTEQNTNLLLSLWITLGFYSVIGILINQFILIFINTKLLWIILGFFILTYLIYSFLNKQIGKLRLPFLFDVILYFYSLLIYVGVTSGTLSTLGLFNKENEELYSSLLSILFLFIILIVQSIKQRI